MKRQFSTLALLLVVLFPSVLSADAVEEGRELTALFYAGDVDAVWQRMTTRMRSALGSAPAFATFAGQVGAQLGREVEVLDESDFDRFSQQFGQPAPHQTATKDHHPMALLLLYPSHSHQLGQMFGAGHNEGLILRQ